MESFENLIHRHSARHHTKLQKITEPLSSSFGITEFWHYTIRGDGTFSYLANHVEISEYYYGSHLYEKCPLFRHPDQFESVFTLSNTLRDEGYIDSQGEIQRKFNMQFPFNMIRKEGNVCHGFGFSTLNSNFPLDSVCINHLPLLNKFCDFFMEETAQMEEELWEEKFNMGKLMGSAFHQPVPPLMNTCVDLKDFYKKLNRMNRWNRGDISLTEREKRCLAHFLQRKTYREIAEALDLSPRSVETYFLTMKAKLNCETQSELFKCVQELAQFGLLAES